jgi:hypothetical protein
MWDERLISKRILKTNEEGGRLVSMDQIKVQGHNVVNKPPGSIKGEEFI